MPTWEDIGNIVGGIGSGQVEGAFKRGRIPQRVRVRHLCLPPARVHRGGHRRSRRGGDKGQSQVHAVPRPARPGLEGRDAHQSHDLGIELNSRRFRHHQPLFLRRTIPKCASVITRRRWRRYRRISIGCRCSPTPSITSIRRIWISRRLPTRSRGFTPPSGNSSAG